MAKGTKSKVWFEVVCWKHGVRESSDSTGTPRVKIAPPKHLNSNYYGCPMCKGAKEKD